ncbi:MAG: chemotaxis response regulator protein-glutamate methylesterase [Pseudomonadota bacterium]
MEGILSIKVLIVDDSATIRAILRHTLQAESDIEVVGEAGDPYEAREAIKELAPDVVTLDIEMPRMSGIEFLGHLMRLRPTPVIMISTLTEAGADATIEALSIGAVDYIAKPSGGNLMGAFGDLPHKVRVAARSKFPGTAKPAAASGAATQRYRAKDRIVAIGASTGGVEALTQVISSLPAEAPPVVITQHMPAKFTSSFAQRLNGKSAVTVVEAQDGQSIEAGHVYLAPGGDRHLEVLGTSRPSCRLVETPPVNGHCPSVDVLFRSVLPFGARAVAVILTGMGNDGAAGIKEVRDAGALTLGQNQESSVVYGMARVAMEQGGIASELPLSKIAPAILEHCGSYY